MVVRNGVERGGEVCKCSIGVGERDGGEGEALCKELAMWEAALDGLFQAATDCKGFVMIEACATCVIPGGGGDTVVYVEMLGKGAEGVGAACGDCEVVGAMWSRRRRTRECLLPLRRQSGHRGRQGGRKRRRRRVGTGVEAVCYGVLQGFCAVVEGRYDTVPVEGERMSEWRCKDGRREVCKLWWDWEGFVGLVGSRSKSFL